MNYIDRMNENYAKVCEMLYHMTDMALRNESLRVAYNSKLSEFHKPFTVAFTDQATTVEAMRALRAADFNGLNHELEAYEERQRILSK